MTTPSQKVTSKSTKSIGIVRYIAMKPRHDVGTKTYPRLRWTVLCYEHKKDAIRCSELPTNKEVVVLHIPKHLQDFFYETYYKDTL